MGGGLLLVRCHSHTVVWTPSADLRQAFVGGHRHLSFVISFSVMVDCPGPCMQLFDDVIIFAAGTVLYHGPVAGAVPFFTRLGFECPPRKDVPSFLLEVTTASGGGGS